MEKRKCLQIFFTRSLEGWRQAEVHNIWQNVTPLQLPGHVCTAKAKLCTLCKFGARVTRLSKTLCTCTHSQGLCTVHSAGVYYLDIAFNMQVILVKYIFAHAHMVLLLVTDLSGRFEHLGSTYIHNICNVKGLVSGDGASITSKPGSQKQYTDTANDLNTLADRVNNYTIIIGLPEY